MAKHVINLPFVSSLNDCSIIFSHGFFNEIQHKV